MNLPSLRLCTGPFLAFRGWATQEKLIRHFNSPLNPTQILGIGHARNPSPPKEIYGFQTVFKTAASNSSTPVINGESEEADFAWGDDIAELGVEESFSPAVNISEGWGDVALRCADIVLSMPKMVDLRLFSLKASGSRLLIRLDKVTNEFGSPELRDIQEFSRAMTNLMDEKLGEKEAGEIEMEVSSPGAERHLRIPEDFARFTEFPMKVRFDDGNMLFVS